MKATEAEINRLRDTLALKEEFYESLRNLHGDLVGMENEIQEERNSLVHRDHIKSDVWTRIKNTLDTKYTHVFESYEGDEMVKKNKKDPLTPDLEKQYKTSTTLLVKRLNECDPYHEIESKMLKKEAAWTFDVYREELIKTIRPRVNNESLIPTYMEAMGEYFNYSRILSEKKNEIQLLEEFIDFINKEKAQIQYNLNCDIERKEETEYNVEKELSNIYVQMRFTKSFVEIDMTKIVDLLKDAILIKKKIIDVKNERILKWGDEKVSKLIENLKQKNTVEDLRYNVMIKDLDIEDKIIESMAITRLKVTKDLQRALAKNETQMSEVSISGLTHFIDRRKEYH